MDDCFWKEVFDNNSRKNLQNGNAFIATISALSSACITGVIFFSNLRSDLSYRNIGFFTLASFLRASVYVSLHLLLPEYQKSLITCEIPCNLLGFWESFLSVYEVECLTHVCIERYVVAKYIVNGWEIQRNHYGLYQFLCVMFSAAYSLPPLLGMGKFALDFSCDNYCILDMVLPATWDRYIIVIIYLLRSAKSTGFMILMLIWAHQREARFNSSKNYASISKFTKNVIKVTILNLSLWLPITVIRGWVIFSSLVYSHTGSVPTSFWIQLAMWAQWVAPAMTALTMFYLDDTLRYKLKRIYSSSESKEVIKSD